MSGRSSNNDLIPRGNQREIEEDGPQYRSVMLAPPMPRPVTVAPPPTGMKFARPSMKSPFSSETSTKTSSTSSKKSTWTIAHPTPLPSFYMLERTHVSVDSPAQEIAERVCKCLYSLNISATEVTDDTIEHDSSSSLVCETNDCLKFAVKLFSHEGNFVVEVQRLSGCAYAFREASRAVLRASKGGDSPKIPPKRKFTIPPSLPSRTAKSEESCVRDQFEIAMSMLRSKRLDSQALALDSLEHMTKTGRAVNTAAKLVLGVECLEHLMSLLEGEEDEMPSPTIRRVLGIVANSFSALSSADLAEMISSNDDLKAASFLSSLLSVLREASERPHDAYQAARCLQHLLISKEVENFVMEMSCMEVVESAFTTGCNSFLALEQESRKLKMQLRSVC